ATLALGWLDTLPTPLSERARSRAERGCRSRSPDTNTPVSTAWRNHITCDIPISGNFRRADHWVGVNMTGKTPRGPRENQLRTETGSIGDQIVAALCSAETEACARVTGLPLAPLFLPMPAPSLHCALTPIDDRGRLADRSPIRAVGWPPGQSITISVVQE